jgi:hypothetical protein
LIVLEQTQKVEHSGARIRCGAHSRIGHVGKSQTNKARKVARKGILPERSRASTYFIASAGSMNFFTTNVP